MFKTIEEAIAGSESVPGVVFKSLKTFPDDRGFFREIIRSSDPFFSNSLAQSGFGQWSHSKMCRHTVKAWHFHHRQFDWWYVGIGVIHTVLFDNREESPSFRRKLEFKLGDSEADSEALNAVVRIPPGVLHGCKVLSDVAHLFYITSETYNPEDEGRHPFDSDLVPHDWGKKDTLTVAPNDCRTFVPPHPRTARADSSG